MDSQQIFKSVLKSAIQKAFRKNFPVILEDAIGYLEEHDWQVKERRKRSREPSPSKTIKDLEKRTDKNLSKTAQKMKTTPYLNLNTNRVHSNSEKIKGKYPELQFGNLIQGTSKVWVCGTPGRLQSTLTDLTQHEEKEPAIFEPLSPMNTLPEDDLNDQSLSDLSDDDDADMNKILVKMMNVPEEEPPLAESLLNIARPPSVGSSPPPVRSSSPSRAEKPPQIPNSLPLFLEKPVYTEKKLKRRRRPKKS